MIGKLRVAWRAPHPPADFEAGHAGDHPVENDEVRRTFEDAQVGLVAPRDAFDDEAFRLQIVGQEDGQRLLVLDDENARCTGGRRRRGRRRPSHVHPGHVRDVHAAATRQAGMRLAGEGRALRALDGQHLAGREIDDRLGDIRRMVADPFDVLRTEQEMRAERDIARILHHEGEEVAEDAVFQRVEFGVAHPHGAGAFDVAMGVGVEHVFEEERGCFVHRLQADGGPRHARFGCDDDGAFRDVLGKVADTLEIGGDADRGDDLAQIHGHRLPPGDGEDRLFLDLALQQVDARIDGDGGAGEVRVEAEQRVHRVAHGLLGEAAHLRDFATEEVELLVVRCDDMIGHRINPSRRAGEPRGQPNRPVM